MGLCFAHTDGEGLEEEEVTRIQQEILILNARDKVKKLIQLGLHIQTGDV